MGKRSVHVMTYESSGSGEGGPAVTKVTKQASNMPYWLRGNNSLECVRVINDVLSRGAKLLSKRVKNGLSPSAMWQCGLELILEIAATFKLPVVANITRGL